MNQQGIGQMNALSYLWGFACREFTVNWTSDNPVSLSWRLADSSLMDSRGEGRLREVVPSWKKASSSFSKLSTFTLGLISVDRKLEEKYSHILLGPETGKQTDRFIPKELKLWVMNYLCDLMDYNPQGSSVHGILQTRILEWVSISSSRGSSWPTSWILGYQTQCK